MRLPRSLRTRMRLQVGQHERGSRGVLATSRTVEWGLLRVAGYRSDTDEGEAATSRSVIGQNAPFSLETLLNFGVVAGVGVWHVGVVAGVEVWHVRVVVSADRSGVRVVAGEEEGPRPDHCTRFTCERAVDVMARVSQPPERGLGMARGAVSGSGPDMASRIGRLGRIADRDLRGSFSDCSQHPMEPTSDLAVHRCAGRLRSRIRGPHPLGCFARVNPTCLGTPPEGASVRSLPYVRRRVRRSPS